MNTHDVKWAVLMVFVIVMGGRMMEYSLILGAVQMTIGALSLGTKLIKLVK